MKRILKILLLIPAVLLALAAELHLLRLFFSLPAAVNALEIPTWACSLVFLATGGLACAFFRAAFSLRN